MALPIPITFTANKQNRKLDVRQNKSSFFKKSLGHCHQIIGPLNSSCHSKCPLKEFLFCRGVEVVNYGLQDEKIGYSRPRAVEIFLCVRDWWTPILKLRELTKDCFKDLAFTDYVPIETIEKLYFNKADELSFLYGYFIKKKTFLRND
ncbi:hypothetical protein AVEN_121828-1 [Araneus ventricosus]|uniref:Uncharacterized protein n=1 Tax=Araneus ventricosus TaxID=182803 RepID=A0A4Y2NZ70_ARAVE|nr:hypothetical protein AVEN_121828-1 [Araneus ventricosus]